MGRGRQWGGVEARGSRNTWAVRTCHEEESRLMGVMCSLRTDGHHTRRLTLYARYVVPSLSLCSSFQGAYGCENLLPLPWSLYLVCGRERGEWRGGRVGVSGGLQQAERVVWCRRGRNAWSGGCSSAAGGGRNAWSDWDQMMSYLVQHEDALDRGDDDRHRADSRGEKLLSRCHRRRHFG